MSTKVTRVLCYVFYALVSVLIIFGLTLYLFQMYFTPNSCGINSKELIEIVNLNEKDTTLNSTQNNNQTETQPDIDFTGRYKMIKSENFDKFLEKLGVGFLQRTLANRAQPEYEITKSGDFYTLKTISQFKTSEITFKLNGDEFEENRLDGTPVKSSVVQRGNKWIQKQVSEDNTVKIVREFKGDDIVVTGVLNDVAFVRIYRRIKN